ncbi:MAG: DUF192 domain-containing protein [Anaerolineales bacterium]
MTSAFISINNKNRPLRHPLQLKVCNNFNTRLKGYLFSPPPKIDEGLIFDFRSSSRINSAIHMLGVPFPLAIIWLDERKIVVDKCIAYPWKLAYIPRLAARYVIECSPERMEDFEINDAVTFSD